MPQPIRVVPETMQAAGAALTSTAQDMAGGLSGLQSTIQGDANPWGADEPGTLFGQLYTVVLAKAFDGIASHVEQVGYAGQALTQQAGTYSEVETGLTTAFSKTAAGLG
jgi:hypothetical protein